MIGCEGCPVASKVKLVGETLSVDDAPDWVIDILFDIPPPLTVTVPVLWLVDVLASHVIPILPFPDPLPGEQWIQFWLAVTVHETFDVTVIGCEGCPVASNETFVGEILRTVDAPCCETGMFLVIPPPLTVTVPFL